MDVNSKYWDAETYLTLIKDVPIVRSWMVDYLKMGGIVLNWFSKLSRNTV